MPDGVQSADLIDQRLKQEGLSEKGPLFKVSRFGLSLLAPGVEGLARVGASPDRISLLSLVFAACASALLLSGFHLSAAIFLLASGACDLLDGWVARIRGIASTAGELIDTLCDRLSESLVFLALGFVWFLSQESSLLREFGVLGSVLALTGSLMMSFASAVILASPTTGKRKAVSRGAMRRPERAVLTGMAVLLQKASPGFSVALLWVMGVGALISAVARILEHRENHVQADRAAQPKTNSSSREWHERDQRWLAPGVQGMASLSGLAIHHALGTRLVSEEGKSYIDWVGGIGVASIGHSHPKWAAAVGKQASSYAVGSLTSQTRVKYLELLMERAAPPGVDCVQLYSSGAEAVESALRLAREVTGKKRFANFTGSFHGKTRGVLSLMSGSWKNAWAPFEEPHALELPYADCARCPLGLERLSCGVACGKKAAAMIRSHSHELAAVIFEPMQGTAGNVIPPPDFLREISDAARSVGVLVIADEMITGFGRTGKFWGVDHFGVTPDILTAGKGIAGGFPLSALFTSRSITGEAQYWSAPSGSSSSYGGNALGCAAALATLEIILDDDLVGHSRIRGAEMLAGLQEIAQKYPHRIESVRGEGLFLGVDLKADIQGSQRLFHALLDQGLFSMAYTQRLRIQPALNITSNEVRESLRRFDRGLAALDA